MDVTFPTAFTTKPVVFCQPAFDKVNLTIQVSNVSTTGFRVGLPTVGSTGERDVMWIAFGD